MVTMATPLLANIKLKHDENMGRVAKKTISG
jgi:hypothetical protein